MSKSERMLGVILVVIAPAVGAQSTARDSVEAHVGTRVRIMAPSVRRDRFIGRIDSLNAERVVLDTTGERHRFGFETGPVLVDAYRRASVQRSAIERIDVSGGRTVRRSTIRGALWGALAGALIVGVGNLPQVNASFDDFVKYAPIGAALGGVVGGVVGYALGGERWVPGRFARP
ncbi:MAG TPA: hypothetical protein VH762_16730 [Gemmatimonadaceae bacterium]